MMFYFSNNLEVFSLTKKEEVWLSFNYFQSASIVQPFLKKCYSEIDFPESEKQSYANCYSFMYYLEHGETFYKQARLSPLTIRPILLFYGLVHLLKACLLTMDPLYPRTTSVLAHGVSTRKKKKRHYEFLHDEVKVQKNGLCSFFAEQLFNLCYLEGEKYVMGDLLTFIPELDELFTFTNGASNIILLEKVSGNKWRIPSETPYLFHVNTGRFKQIIEEKHAGKIHWEDPQSLTIKIKKELQPPFRIHFTKKRYCLPATFHPNSTLPDLFIHYLLLYNLSMIARYETEWWLDLIKTTPDSSYSLIKLFLSISEEKSPYLIYKYLLNKFINGPEKE